MDRKAIESLYRQYGPLVLRRARSLLRDDQAALDAMQEVFIRAIRAGSEFRADSSPMTWLYRITTNYCFNEIRNRVRRDELLAEQGVPAEAQPATAADRAVVLQLLARVPEDVGVVALHYFLDEMKQEEVAEHLGVSRRYVRDRLDAFREAADKMAAGPKKEVAT